MADFQFTIDTTAMAHSVDGAQRHISGVNAAVTTMQSAVIATEREASKKICNNVDEGFYMLIRSQVSQKAVAAYTEMSGKQMILLQLAKALDGVKRQMEGDFNMISKRYTKLFQSLNKALETRIREIDRPAMKLAEIKKSIVFDKLKDDSAVLFSISEEALPLMQTASSGKLKQKTKEALLTLSDSVQENDSYSQTVQNILMNNTKDFSRDSETFYLPVVFFATDSLLNSGDSIENVYTVQNDALQNPAPIVSEVNRANKDLHWESLNAEEKGLIRKEFLSLCEKNLSEERVSKEIVRLFDESIWEVCKHEL
jgi:hypothetical protein